MDIPLFEESLTYARVLDSKLRSKSSCSTNRKREVNWARKYNEKFYEKQKKEFIRDPKKYISSSYSSSNEVESIVHENVPKALLLKTIFKCFAHWGFRALGGFQKNEAKLSSCSVYRRCYVDDAELVFDNSNVLVLRAVYPFPLSLKRQIKYIRFLRREKLAYVFVGTPYLVADLVAFVLNPQYRNLMRLEKRAQILHAIELSKYKCIRKVECSEEYDIGSLDHSNMLKRLGVHVLNSAHGVGKYLPYHGYSEFFVLTENQKEYYNFFNAMEYSFRALNERVESLNRKAKPLTPKKGIVLLGQYSEGTPKLIKEIECEIFQIVDGLGYSDKTLVTSYKPHPNSGAKPYFQSGNVRLLRSLDDLENLRSVLYVSMFSTCQIDPNFEGDKILVGSKFIRPEISFSGQTIVELENLKDYLDSWVKEG